jgi:AmmeMemoRadiSam system protein B
VTSRVAAGVRPPFVAGTFYPSDPARLRRLVERLVAEARSQGAAPARHAAVPALGALVPHAGLEYSGRVAAAGWLALATDGGLAVPFAGAASGPGTVVILGTNHVAGWLDGIGVWPAGAWRTPLGDVPVDEALAGDILGLGAPFLADRDAHAGEHSIEVQLPLLQALSPGARIVPLAVATGIGADAVAAGDALGRLLAGRIAQGAAVVLAVSSDMAHYPPQALCERVTDTLLPSILALDAAGVGAVERAMRRAGGPGVACGMCGIEPAVVGLAALRAMRAIHAVPLARATSADAGAPSSRTVGYLAVSFGA